MALEVNFYDRDSFRSLDEGAVLSHSEESSAIIRGDKNLFRDIKHFHQAVVNENHWLRLYDEASRPLSVDEFLEVFDNLFMDLKEPFIIDRSDFLHAEVVHEVFTCDEIDVLVELTHSYLFVTWDSTA